MKRRRNRLTAALTAVAAVAAFSGTAQAEPSAPQAPSQTAAASRLPAPQSRLALPQSVLAPGWQKSGDRALTTSGDADGFHVLVADASSGYQWRTAASLSEPGFDTDEWIGQACLTSSGRYAAVVYAPRSFTNLHSVFDQGSFVAIVDLATGAVRKMSFTASLAYYDPGCGAGDQVAFSSLDSKTSGTRSAPKITTTVRVVDAADGSVVRQSVSLGQLSSPVPYGNGAAAVLGNRVVSLDAKGGEHTLATSSGTPFRLHPDAAGGLAYEVPSGKSVEVRRYAAGSSHLVMTAAMGSVQLTRSGSQLFVIGAGAPKGSAAAKLPGGWKSLAAPVDADISSTGALAVTLATNKWNSKAASPQAGHAEAPASSKPTGAPTQIDIQALVTGTGKHVDFRLDPDALNKRAGSVASPSLTQFGLGSGAPVSGRRGTAVRSKAGTDPSSVTWDPDRGCAVARNDPTIQTYQATAAQVEWAADLAVQGQLTPTRGANWEGSGLPVSWTPQGMFPLRQLTGGGSVPAQVLLGVLAQESNTMQASPHAVDAITGNFNQGGFYGNGSDWATVDCGYGIGQVTTGMAMTTPAGTPVADGNMAYTTAEQQQAVATDYASNIAASLNLLIDKWNQLKAAGIVVGDGDPSKIVNWWFTVWAYNAGVEPGAASFGNTTGCTPGPNCTDNGGAGGNWGLGWANNPANPAYPADRGVFNNSAADTKTPNHWTYPELVTGWAFSPVPRYNYATSQWGPAYAAANGSAATIYPSTMQFCTVADDNCTPNAAPDSTGTANAAGLCALSNSHCWWHAPSTWVDCTANNCGSGNLTYTSASAKPGGTDIYPADCRALGTTGGASSSDSLGSVPPTGSIIVDDVTTPSVASCSQSWTDQGSLNFHFNAVTPNCGANTCAEPIDYPGKIDFHQLGVGFGGHIWFTHTVATSDTAHTVTGTWTPPAITGWYRIKVHIPDSGDTTQQANYTVNLGNGTSEQRVVNTRWSKNTWVDLGAFQLSGQPSVSLSSATADANGADVAWDSVAFTPTTQPATSYVALGDSYSAGEGQDPYDPNSDYYSNGSAHACHRSISNSYARMVTLPGQTTSIAQQAAASNNNVSFAFLACSGDLTINMTPNAVDNPPTADDNAGSTSWGHTSFGWGELQQLNEGFLDANTTLVTLSVGGNDARFADVLHGCILTITDCTAPGYKLTRGNGAVDPQPLTTYEPYVINTLLPPHLKAVYDQIHAEAPNARIVVVGYPHLFAPNPSGSCAEASTADQTWMNQMSDDLDNTISTVVGQVQAEGANIGFVDPRAAFDGTGGHWACEAGGTAWLNALVNWSETGSSNGSPEIPGTGSFHPTAAGQTEYAQLVNAFLAQ